MKKNRWNILFAGALIVVSVCLYYVHYVIFRDPWHMFYYLVEDLAFIPVSVLIVTIILENILNRREKRSLRMKLNMVIGVFFSEAGMDLIKCFCTFDSSIDEMREKLLVNAGWKERDFTSVKEGLKKYEAGISSRKGKLPELRGFLIQKRVFLLALLENPNLLEHEKFTDLLWAVFHLAEELSCRKQVDSLSHNDYEHLSLDIKRAYILLIQEWLEYMRHLKKSYPYLFSLAVRLNPFAGAASPEIP
jgi:hypothetical protein